MDFEEKKMNLKNDSIPFILGIPAVVWLDIQFCLGVPVLFAAMIPVICYIIYVIMNLIGFWLWRL